MVELIKIDERYSIDNDGNIYSTNYKNSGKVRMLSPALDAKGYLKTVLHGKSTRVHRFIAVHLVPNPEGLPHINHKNGVKTDNRVENLEWCTNKSNIEHAYRMGLIKTKSKWEHHNSVLSQSDYLYIKEQVELGRSFRSLSREFGRDKSVISRAYKRIKHG